MNNVPAGAGQVSPLLAAALANGKPGRTVSEAAQYLRISWAPLYHLIRHGRIQTVTICARTIVRGSELERFIDQQQAAQIVS
jgi:hypothetical protein